MSSDSVYKRAPKEQRRVVVTGIGAVTPVGLNIGESWANLIEGKSGISKIQSIDTENHSVKIAGEILGFDADKYVNKKDQKKMGRFIHLALAASEMAIEDSGIELTEELKSTAGAMIGVGIGGLQNIEQQSKICNSRGPSRITPFFIPAVITNLAAGHVSIVHGLKGPNYSVTSACASGSHSIGEAVNYIRNGNSEVMLAGGTEAVVCDMAIGGFAAMKALSTRNDEPEMASRPWDKDRDGFVLGEGSAVLVLENYEHAAQRGARIYGEVTGYGVSSDAYHMTSPAPGGTGAAQAMNMCLKDASLNPEDIDYINAHGTSTPMGDLIETQAVQSVFKDHSKNLWMSSTKSMTGHTLGAAGAIESAISLMSLSTNKVPPTINLDNPSEGCDLDYVPTSARDKELKHVLNNSFGFGGTNACITFSKI